MLSTYNKKQASELRIYLPLNTKLTLSICSIESKKLSIVTERAKIINRKMNVLLKGQK